MRRLFISTSALTLALCMPTTADEPSENWAGNLPDGVTLVETVEKTGDEIVIPYHKLKLENGLTVVLHEDDSDPLVHVDVTYHVGSAREDVGKSGFAHFFEHMMFQGSENVGDEEHFKIVSESGGTLNGTTNTDRTNYFQTVPANQLEKMLWLESDRMGYFLDAVTQRKFEVQRETVKNERNQNYDNRPYGLVFERVSEAMYPEGHPYSWLTIGYIEDLNRADLNDLKAFFLRWYGPNNSTLTIGGDIDVEQTIEWVNKYFGPIPAGPEVEDMPPMPVSLEEDRYISMEDNVALPLIFMAWPTVHARHPDEAPLDVLMSIMGDGRTSLLYKNLVRDNLAVQANASHPCRELHCLFTFTALPNPASGATLADLDKAMRHSLTEFESRGVEDDDLERVKAGIISGKIFGLESVSGKASQLAFYETFTGNPNYTADDIERYESVTKDDVMRVYNEYIKDKPAVIMSVVPNGQADAIAREDTWERTPRTIPESSSIDDSELALRDAPEPFDRSIQPEASDENPSVSLPEIWRGNLENGIEVLGAINDETPTTAIQLRLEIGQRAESLDKLGLASLTASMLGEATQSSTNEELSNRLAKLGSSLSLSTGDRYTTVTIRSLSESLDETLDIALERILEPKFDEADFARVKDQTLQGIESSKKQASYVASTVFEKLLYGADNSFAYAESGLTETVEAITLDDVKAFYETYYAPNLVSMVVVSDIPQNEMMDELSKFSAWEGEAEAPPFDPVLPEREGGVLYLVDKPGAAQSEIRIGKRALPYDATGEYYRAGLMNYALGGAFNSRINLNLREDKGYTYGARSYFSGDDDMGSYVARGGVRSDVTAESIIEFVNEIKAYEADGPTPAEIDFTKQSIGQRDARDYETPFQKLRLISRVLTYDLPLDFVDQQKAILADIEEPELDALADELLDFEDMFIVVVGDKAKILPSLEELGYPIVELDDNAEPLN